jgi:protein-disulfide isomerase
MSGGRLDPPVGERDHVDGPATAAITLVEYGDYQCPYCGMAYPIVKTLQRELGDELRFVFRNFPLRDAHPHAEHAAEIAEAAAAQGKFWEMHDALYEHQDRLGDRDLLRLGESLGLDVESLARELDEGTYAKRVREDFRSGVVSGVNGTPTFFVNGERYDGVWDDAEQFLRALRESVGATAARTR